MHNHDLSHSAITGTWLWNGLTSLYIYTYMQSLLQSHCHLESIFKKNMAISWGGLTPCHLPYQLDLSLKNLSFDQLMCHRIFLSLIIYIIILNASMFPRNTPSASTGNTVPLLNPFRNSVMKVIVNSCFPESSIRQ